MKDIIEMPPIFSQPLSLIEDLAERMNTGQGFTSSVNQLLGDANIKVTIEGESADWTNEGQGALLLGDHRQRIEYIPIVGAMGELGRNC